MHASSWLLERGRLAGRHYVSGAHAFQLIALCISQFKSSSKAETRSRGFDTDPRPLNLLLLRPLQSHLTSSHTLSELITLHVSSSKSSRPYSLGYSIRGLTLSPNGCPISTVSAQKASPLVQTEIKVRTPSAAPR